MKIGIDGGRFRINLGIPEIFCLFRMMDGNHLAGPIITHFLPNLRFVELL